MRVINWASAADRNLHTRNGLVFLDLGSRPFAARH